MVLGDERAIGGQGDVEESDQEDFRSVVLPDSGHYVSRKNKSGNQEIKKSTLRKSLNPIHQRMYQRHKKPKQCKTRKQHVSSDMKQFLALGTVVMIQLQPLYQRKFHFGKYYPTKILRRPV